jgi:hypothetical protein
MALPPQTAYLALVERPQSFVGMLMSIILDINAVLVEQIFQIGPENLGAITDLKTQAIFSTIWWVYV